MATEQLSALDVAFLSLEADTSPMHIGALAVFTPQHPVHPARLATLLRERAARVPRMRQRVRSLWFPPGGAVWTEDPEFNADNHIHTHRLRRPGGRDQLATYVSDLMAMPLDLHRPLWQVHVITGLAGGQFAVLAKLHHALCDGAGAIGLGLNLLDGFGGDGAAAPVPDEGANGTDLPVAPSQAGVDLAAGLLALPGRWVGDAVGMAVGLPGVVRHARESLGIASSVVLRARPPSPSPFLARSSRERQLAMVRLDLEDLQRVRRRHGGTVNDVLLAVLSGALGEWLAGNGHATDRLRALIPVSQRCRLSRQHKSQHNGNQLSGYLCDLPVGEPDPLRRLRTLRETMERNKAAGPSRGAGAIPVLAGRIPSAVHRLAGPIAAHVAPLLFDIVITNVPLPGIPLPLDGAELREVYPIVPLASGHALGIALSSYRGGVHVGLYADRGAFPGATELGEAVPRALAALEECPPAARSLPEPAKTRGR